MNKLLNPFLKLAQVIVSTKESMNKLSKAGIDGSEAGKRFRAVVNEIKRQEYCEKQKKNIFRHHGK